MATGKNAGDPIPERFDEIAMAPGQTNGVVATAIQGDGSGRTARRTKTDGTPSSRPRDLDRIITARRAVLLVPQAVDYLIQAARDIEAVHAKGIVHGDIKPGNLMLDTTGTVRVLNPGLGRIDDANNPIRSDRRRQADP